MPALRNKYIRLTVSWTIIIAFIIGCYYVLKDNFTEVSELKINYIYIVHVTVSILIMFYCRGMVQGALVRPFNVVLGHFEKLSLSVIPTAINNILPANAGFVYKMTYLKTVYQIDWIATGVYLVVSWVTITVADSVVGLAALLYEGFYVNILTGVFAVILIISVALLFFPSEVPFFNHIKFVNRLMLGWSKMKEKPIYIFHLVKASLLLTIANGIVAWACCRMLDINISFYYAMILGCIRSISTYINLTPGSLGTTEFIVTFSAVYLGVDKTYGLLMSLLMRTGMTSVSFALAPFLYYYLKLKMKKVKTGPEGQTDDKPAAAAE